jgi:hypothetical protein
MGMYDSINVEKSLIDNLYKENKFLTSIDEKYYSFQTKDLDNALNEYFLEADGTLLLKRVQYEVIEERDLSRPFSPLFREVGESMENTNISAYINFYDCFCHEDERLFVTFKAHIANGKLVNISLSEIEMTDLKKEAEYLKIHKQIWDIQTSTWEYKLSRFIFNIKLSIRKFFSPITRSIEDLEFDLMRKSKEIAEAKFKNK